MQAPLAAFFGRRGLNDALLPLIITCLNAPDWLLRSAFFRAVADIGAEAGAESLGVFLLPCLEQVRCETVVVNILYSYAPCVILRAPVSDPRCFYWHHAF